MESSLHVRFLWAYLFKIIMFSVDFQRYPHSFCHKNHRVLCSDGCLFGEGVFQGECSIAL